MRETLCRLYNTGFDRAYGISTLETPELRKRSRSARSDELPYVPIDYLALHFLLASVRLAADDVFVDIGCGLGRAVLTAARRNIRQAIGIEYNSRLADGARENAARLRGRRAAVEILTVDASLADYGSGTVFWMYNPFGRITMTEMLARLRQSLIETPRRITIVYANPVLADVLDSQDWLQRRGGRRFPLAGDNGRALYWQNGTATGGEA